MTTPRRGPEISLAQVAGGALAAISAAVIASFLGVGGTVVGAAIGSVVASVGGAIYSHSFKRAGEQLSQTKVVTVVTRARMGADDPGPSDVPAMAPDQDIPALANTGGEVTGQFIPPVGEPAAASEDDASDVDAAVVPVRLRRVNWKTAAVLAVVAFVVAIAAIEAVEVLIGRPISGGSGTTVTKLFHGHQKKATKTPAPTPTLTPTTTPTTSPTSTSSVTQTATPTYTPTGTGSPTSSDPTTDQPTTGAPTAG